MSTDWLFRPLSPVASHIAIAVLAVGTCVLVIVPLWRLCRSKFNVALIAGSILAGVLIVVGLLQEPWRLDWVARQIGLQRSTPRKKEAELAPSYTRSANPEKLDLVALAKGARSAVVSIEVFDDEHNSIGTGSGFFVSNDGLLVTNYHVIEKASSAVAKTASGDQLSIKGAVYFDRDHDLAVLLAEGKKFPFLPLGNSSKIEVGDHVAVIGSPLGLEGSLSEGIVSAKRELPPIEKREASSLPRLAREPASAKREWLQITAPISPGSSGSPVLDTSGDVIGIATMVLRGGQSLNFAVPIEVAIAMIGSEMEQDSKQRPIQPLALLAQFNKNDKSLADFDALHSPELAALRGAVFAATTAVVVHKPAGWEKALSLAKAFVAKHPDFATGFDLLGKVYEGMGFSEEAISANQQAIKLNPEDVEAWGALGSIFKEKGRDIQADFAFSQAIAYQTKWVESLPESDEKASALSILADIYHSAGDNKAAERSYLDALRISPHDFAADSWLDSLATIYAEEGNEQDALRMFYRWASVHKLSNPEAQAWWALSQFYDERHNEEASLRCFIKARSLGLKR